MSQLNINNKREPIVEKVKETNSEGEGTRKRKGNASIALQLKKIKLLQDLFEVSSLKTTLIFKKYNTVLNTILLRTQKQ